MALHKSRQDGLKNRSIRLREMIGLEVDKQKKCRVFLISGFLGSGKTTLLKHLLNNVPEGEKVAVLMNEFGKAGVDGDLVRKNGLEVIEISRGSIFCACAKGDFLRALYNIFKDYFPTVLFVEASGVANTTDMKKDLDHGMLGGFYAFNGNICVVDAYRFEDWFDLFNAVPMQAKAATHIVINKTDLVSERELKALEKHIAEINPYASVTKTSFCKIPWHVFDAKKKERENAEVLPMPEEWEKYIEQALCDMTAHLAPPDSLASYSIYWYGDPKAFKNLIEEDIPEDIVRSKGYFKNMDGRWKIFDIVGHKKPVYSDPEPGFGMPRNLAIFIRTKRDRKELPYLFQSKGLKLLEVRF